MKWKWENWIPYLLEYADTAMYKYNEVSYDAVWGSMQLSNATFRQINLKSTLGTTQEPHRDPTGSSKNI